MWFLAWLAFLALSLVVWYVYKIGPRKLVVYGFVSLGVFWMLSGYITFTPRPERICKTDNDRPLRQEIVLSGKNPAHVKFPGREVVGYQINRDRVAGDLVIEFAEGHKDTWSQGERKSASQWSGLIPTRFYGHGTVVLLMFRQVCAEPAEWARIEAAKKAKALQAAAAKPPDPPAKSDPPPARPEPAAAPRPEPPAPEPARSVEASPPPPPPTRPEAPPPQKARRAPPKPTGTRYVEVPLKGERWVSVRSLVPRCTRWTFEATDRTELQLLDGSVDTILPASERKEYPNTRPSRVRGEGVFKLWLHEPVGDCTAFKR